MKPRKAIRQALATCAENASKADRKALAKAIQAFLKRHDSDFERTDFNQKNFDNMFETVQFFRFLLGTMFIASDADGSREVSGASKGLQKLVKELRQSLRKGKGWR